MVDYIHEDLDTMDEEYIQWKKEAAKYQIVLKDESSKTLTTVAPIEKQLANVEESIQEKVAFISLFSSSIRNLNYNAYATA